MSFTSPQSTTACLRATCGLALLTLWACANPADPDAGASDAATLDASARDAAPLDASIDAATLDSGTLDAGTQTDGGFDPEDAGPSDQGITDAGQGPVFEEEPTDRTVTAGEAATFHAIARGDPTPTLQWERSLDGTTFQLLPAATSTTYRTDPTTHTDDGHLFRAVAVNDHGRAISRAARLSVFVPGQVSDPQSQEAIVDATATFTIAMDGQPQPILQWQRAEATTPTSFVDLLGATGPTYTTPPLTTADDGANFRVAWTNTSADGTLSATGETSVATLTVIDALTATQILASERWSLVLRPDGTVAGFGEYISLTGAFTFESSVARRPVQLYPGILNNIFQLTGRGLDWWALRADGTVVHWGYAGYGSDGRGNDGNGSGGPPSGALFRSNFTPVEVLERVMVAGVETAVPVSGVCRIASGDRTLLMVRAVDSSGTPTSCAPGAEKTLWYTGILETSSPPPIAVTATPVPRGELPSALSPNYSPIAAVYDWRNGSSGTTLFFIVLEDGRSFGLGANGAGFGNAFALPGAPGYATAGGGPIEVTSIWDTQTHPVQSAVLGWYAAFVVRQVGTVLSHGYATAGVLGNGTVDTPNAGPALVKAETCTQLPCASVLTGVTEITADFGGRVLVIKDGALYGWGVAGSGVLGPLSGIQRFPIRVGVDTGFEHVALGSTHALALRQDGAVFAWGDSSWGQNADPGQQTLSTPTLVTLP